MLRRLLWRRQRPFTCTDVDANVEQVRDGRLSARETAAFKAHVAECNTCRQRLQTEAAWLTGLQTTPAPARLTPSERRAMQQALGQQMRRRMVMRNIRLSFQQVAVLGVLALVVGAMVWWQTAVTPTENLDNPTTTELSDTAPSAENQEAEQIILQFAVDDNSLSSYETLITAFEQEHPNIRIQLKSIPNITAGLAPAEANLRLAQTADVFDGRTLFGANWQQLMLDLTPFINTTPSFNRDDFPPNILTEPDGTVRILPISLNPVFLAYNKTLFNAADLAQPQPGWTWEEFRVAANTLTIREDEQTVQWGLAHAFPGSFSFYLSQATGWLIDWSDNPPRPRFTDPDIVQAVRQHTDLYLVDEVGLDDSKPAAYDEAENLIAAGRAAMWPIFYTQLGSYAEIQDIGIVTFPTKEQHETTIVYVDGFSISAGTAHPQAAWEWINFLSHQPPVAVNGIPARQSTQEAGRFWQNIDLEVRNVVEYGLTHGFKYYFHPANRPFVNAVTDILTKNTPVEEALTEAESAAAQILDGDEIEEEVIVAGPVSETTTDEAITIVFIPHPFSELEPYRVAAQQFQTEHPDIQVEVREPYLGNSANMGRDGEAGDCFQWGMDILYDQEKREAILSLDAFIQADTAFDLTEFYPSLVEAFVFQGELWGLPADAAPYIIQYNKDLFDAANLSYPQPGWTMQEFLDTAVALTRGEDENKQYGFVPEAVEQRFLITILNHFGANWIDISIDPATLNFSDPATVATIRWYTDLSQTHNVKPLFIMDVERAIRLQDVGAYFEERRQLIQGERAGMWVYSSNSNFGLNESLTEGLTNLGAVPLPLNSGGQTDLGLQLGYFIAADTPHRQACWQWLTFLTTVDVATGIPARRSLAESAAYRQRVGEEIARAQIATLEQRGTLNPLQTQYQWLSPGNIWLFRAVSQIAEEDIPVEAALANAQNLFDVYRNCVSDNDAFHDIQAQNNCAQTADPTFPDDYLAGSSP